MKPIPFAKTAKEAKAGLKKIMEDLYNSTLVTETADFLHFEVITKTGKFTDDVIFKLDDENKVIDFRSASRVGYHDLGANRRRMKKITKHFVAIK